MEWFLAQTICYTKRIKEFVLKTLALAGDVCAHICANSQSPWHVCSSCSGDFLPHRTHTNLYEALGQSAHQLASPGRRKGGEFFILAILTFGIF